MRLQGKVAIVTGAASGIGQAISVMFATEGAAVVVDYVGKPGTADDTLQKIAATGGRSVAVQADVSDPVQVQNLIDQSVSAFGRVDILVNNAGIAISFRPAESMDDATWLKVLDVNLNGVFWCSRTFGNAMLEQGGGNIVNVGSMSADIVNRPQEQAQYNASKAGVHHLTKSLAAEWAKRNVRVNAVAPTYIETDLTRYVYDDPKLMQHWVGNTPMARMGQPEEIASVILFLASEAASLMTGSIVTVDGGYTCW